MGVLSETTRWLTVGVSLPVLKLTKRPAISQSLHDFTHGEIPPERTCIPPNCEETKSHDLDEMMDCLFTSDTSDEPTLHALESRAAAAGWQKIRKDILDVLTENAAFPPDQVCQKCYGGHNLIQLHFY